MKSKDEKLILDEETVFYILEKMLDIVDEKKEELERLYEIFSMMSTQGYIQAIQDLMDWLTKTIEQQMREKDF